MKIDPKVPSGPLEEKWTRYRSVVKLVSPGRKQNFTVIVVGTGLAGASAAATLAELGYYVTAFCFQDSARRAHSVAAQGGINAAKNYRNDGDSTFRLFSETIAGGDYRSREANVYRLAEISGAVIDHCVAQGVPFAREYSGYLANRSFGGSLVSRTFYCRGQTGQQLLLGAYAALCRQVGLGRVKMFPRTEMLDLVVAGGKARGVVTRDLVTGRVDAHSADAVVLATGGYANVYFLSTNARGANATAVWRAYRRGAGFANPCFTQVHPTCIPQSGDYQVKLTLMSEALRNDGRVWVTKRKGNAREPAAVPESERDYFLERMYPGYGNLAPRDLASRAAKRVCDEGRGVGPGGRGVYLDLTGAVARLGENALRERYGNLLEIYERISGENPLNTPMRIYPAPHYTMGGLWVDYGLQSTIPGLFVLGEANFSEHGANRLGASALMQGLADGYFIIPYTLGEYFGGETLDKISPSDQPFVDAIKEVEDRVARILAVRGKRTVDSFHRQLGVILWEHCGMSRNAAGLTAAVEKIRLLRAEFWKNVRVPGDAADLNQELEKAGRVADYLELGELMCRDALAREESCGCHFREEFQTACGEALRDDRRFGHVAVWEHAEQEREPVRHVEPLTFETIIPAERSYK